MTTTKRKLLTAEDLLELHSKGIKGELIRGVSAKPCLLESNTVK